MTENTNLDETDDLPRALTVPQSLAVGIARAEIDQQITTARAYPRSLKQVSDRVFSLATLDRESAEESMYALPRGGKPITGPSIRFAEIVKQAYGNCRAAARVVHVDRDEKYVEAEGVFHDLETNVATTARVRRRIVDSKGRLYSDDMIIVTGNAACSIALRNAIMGGVPKPLWRKAYEAVQGAIKGDITTLTENRAKALQAFAVYGVKPDQVYAALDVRGAEDITMEHLPLLRGMFATLKNGEATVEEMFGSLTAPATPPQSLHAGFSDPGKPAEGPGAPAAKKRAQRASQRVEEAQETQAGGVGDALDGDDLPASVKEARPTATAGAPSAEPSPATSGSATDASTDSPGPGDSSRDSFGEQVREVLAEEEQLDVIAEGFPAADEVYHLDGDLWDEEGRRDTYKNGTPFSSAGRKAGLSVYADHAPTEEAARDGEDDGDGDLPTEFKAYVEQVEAATSWQEVKKAMAVFYKTPLFMGMRPDQQNKIRCNTWEIMVENKLPDLPDQAIDISAFRLWIEWCPEADAIEGTMRIWKDDAKYREERPPEFKRQIEGAVADRIRALGT